MCWTEITRAQYRRDGLRYASDMTDAEWKLIEPLMPARSRRGRPREISLRVIMNAILYVGPAAVNGVPCRRTFRRVRQFSITSTAGAVLVCGARLMTPWSGECANGKDANPLQRLGLSTARA